jgi:hypothetical protein
MWMQSEKNTEFKIHAHGSTIAKLNSSITTIPLKVVSVVSVS